MSGDRIEAFLDGDTQAAFHVAKGDLHAACLMRALKARGVPAEAFSVVEEPPPSVERPWMGVRLADKVAYFRIGRLMIGPPGASIRDCRHVNGGLPSVIDNKQMTKELLGILGFPVPIGREFVDDEDGAVAYCRTFGGPVCVKARGRGQGNRVHPGLVTEEEWRWAYRDVSADGGSVLVEAHWPGAAIRFHFIRPRVVGVRHDIPANVDGDGVSNIARLIEVKNAEKRRRTGHIPIAVDEDVMRRLAAQGLSLGDIPEKGRRLYLRAVSNGYKGGDSVNCRDRIHPSYIAEVEKFCNSVIGFRVTAVDTKILDVTIPARPDNYVILEANSNPGMVPFQFPWEGEVQDVAGALADALLDPLWYQAD